MSDRWKHKLITSSSSNRFHLPNIHFTTNPLSPLPLTFLYWSASLHNLDPDADSQHEMPTISLPPEVLPDPLCSGSSIIFASDFGICSLLHLLTPLVILSDWSWWLWTTFLDLYPFNSSISSISMCWLQKPWLGTFNLQFPYTALVGVLISTFHRSQLIQNSAAIPILSYPADTQVIADIFRVDSTNGPE